VLGTCAAFEIIQLLIHIHPGNIPRIEETSMDGRVLLFAVCVSAATAVLAGLIPAWSASRGDLNETLKRSGRSVKRHEGGLQRGLMIAEIALTIVLLVGSGLLIRSFWKLQSVDKGFTSLATATMNIQLDGRYDQPQRQNAFFKSLLERASAVPG